MKTPSFLTDPSVQASMRANHALARYASGAVQPLDAIVIEEILELSDDDLTALMPDCQPATARQAFSAAIERARAA
ncbi:MAG: hypothetical protein KF904_21155 [Rhodoblastus sp.]|nr:hypothetical protein [Rhodoblastus sp.]